MTPHIAAKPGDIAETVLMPGDPLRAKWAAETFLDNPVCVNEVRGMLAFTGTWHGNPVTIHGSGMGMPSLSIYANELLKDYGAKTLIRIGSTGAMQEHVKLRDVILAMTSTTLNTPSSGIFKELHFAPSAAYNLLAADERPDLNVQMMRHCTLAVEMEAAELYILAARYKARALAVLTVSDHLITGEALPSEDRQSSFGDMVEIALEAAFS